MRNRLGPLYSMVFFMGCGLLWLSAARGLAVAWQWSQLHSAHEVRQTLLRGVRLDISSLCYLLLLPALLALSLPAGRLRSRILATLLTAGTTVLFFMEVATPAFFAEYSNRPDRIFFEYLIYPREVLVTLLKIHPVQSVLLPTLTLVLAIAAWRFWRRSLDSETGWAARQRWWMVPVVVVALFIGLRGVESRPISNAYAGQSGNRIANELTLNSSFSLAYAIYAYNFKEVRADQMYGGMPWPEVLARVRKYTGVAETDFTNAELPSLHRHRTKPRTDGRKPNVVILMEESLGAHYVGRLGGLPLTPNLDRLADSGLWFQSMYCTGTRTSRGMEAVVSGFPPTPAPSVLKLPQSRSAFFTLGALLQQQGYATEFLYGGSAHFDNMRSFYKANGFARVIELQDFTNPVLVTPYAVSDEDLVRKAHETFLGHGEQPFFAVIMSGSNHAPYEFPDGRIKLYEQPPQTRPNAALYADYAIGLLFELARSSAYYANTIFVVVADHESRVTGLDYLPVASFHIPALIIGPGVPVGTYERIASQIDLAPTLVGLLGLEVEHPMPGRDLLSLPENTPGRAIMQLEHIHGFRVDDRLVVHKPGLPAQHYFVGPDDRITPAPQDPELERDALASVLWASESYGKQLYRLPTQ